MNILDKMITTIRGGINEIGEIIIDSQAVRILDQEIRDADEELRKSKETLADFIVQHKKTQAQIVELQKIISEYEIYAIKSLEAKNEALAIEVATEIALLEKNIENRQQHAQNCSTQIEELQQLISEASAYIRSLKQQADTIKATESVQKAQMTIAERYSNQHPKIRTALESLETIKLKQNERSIKLEALSELADLDLHTEELKKKLRSAGILPKEQSAQDILNRLKDRVKS